MVPGEGHRGDRLGHDGRAPRDVSRLRDEHAPGDSVPRPRARRQRLSRAARQGVRGGRPLRVPLHRDADPPGRRHRRAGAPDRCFLGHRGPACAAGSAAPIIPCWRPCHAGGDESWGSPSAPCIPTSRPRSWAYASLRAAWDALPVTLQQRLEDLVALHSFAYSRSLIAPDLLLPEQEVQLPPVKQRLVRANPVNGRQAVYLGSHASHVLGMPVEEGRALLRDLLEHATRPEFVFTHRWRVGDCVMWDNRAVLHRGRDWDTRRYRRVMHRTTVAGDGPTVPDPVVADAAAAR